MNFTQQYVDRGGDRIGLHICPDDGDIPVVVIWPAMGVPARYYAPFVAELRAAGLGVVVADLRGTGASTPRSGRSSRYGYAELVTDVGAVQEALKPRLDGRTVLLLGHSLGGQASALHLALSGDTEVAGLVLVGVGLPYWRSYQGTQRLGGSAYIHGIAAATALLGWWPGWGLGGPKSRGVIRDWAFTARHGHYPPIDGVDAEAALATVRTRVLAVDVEGDTYTPPRVVGHMCAKLANAPVERYFYGRAEAGAALDHFSWIRAGAPLARRVAAFAA